MSDKPDTPDILYHYCSNSTFLSIIESDTIRLSDLSLSNDSQEGRWVKKVFEAYCRAHEVSDDHIDAALRYLDEIIDMARAFGFCTSKNDDSLSQWRAYADNASGVAIGLSKEYLELSSRPNLGRRQCVAGFCRVRYKEDEQRELISGLIETIINISPENHERQTKEEIKQTIAQKTAVFAINNLHLLTLIKNTKFSEEDEYRTFVSFFTQTQRKNSWAGILQHRVSGNGIASFLVAWLRHEGQSPIKRVVLGPRNITPISVIEDLLAKHGHEGVEVIPSKASYR